MHGQYSTKSDVYSFGVLVLEIISGKRNSSFNKTDTNASNLVTYVSMDQMDTSKHSLLLSSIRFQLINLFLIM